MTAAASSDNYTKSYTIGAGGLTVDTAGHAVHCDIPWTGEGGLTVRGEGGSLAVNGTPSFTGDVTVSNGVVVVFDCSHTFAGKLVIGGADAKIRFDTTSYQEDTLTLATGGITLPEGVDNVLDLVELVGEGYMASISDDGKSIVLSLAACKSTQTAANDPAALPAEQSTEIPDGSEQPLYTEGAELIRMCTDKLNEAEQTVVRLQKGSDGAPKETPFPGENET